MHKRGFTVVELVIVIAVIAIISGIAIPSVSYMIEKSKFNQDVTMLEKINASLELEDINNKAKTLYDAFSILEKYDYKKQDIKLLSKNELVWLESSNRFALLDGDEIKYFLSMQPDETIWKIIDDVNSIDVNSNYGYYLNGENVIDSLDVQNSFDAGENEIKQINIKDNNKKLLVRTNNGNLSIGNLNHNISHYGNVDVVIINDDKGSSTYSEYGTVNGRIEYNNGIVTLENNSFINYLKVNNANYYITKRKCEVLYSNVSDFGTLVTTDVVLGGGSGTNDNPYQIHTPKQLLDVYKYTNNYFKISRDLDFSCYKKVKPIEKFMGHLDGNNKTILNLNVYSDDNAGLFKTITNASSVNKLNYEYNKLHDNNENAKNAYKTVIENIKFLSCTVTGKDKTGILCSSLNNSFINNIKFISCTVNGESNVGSVSGFMQKSAISEVQTDKLSKVYGASNNIGGIVGTIEGNCYLYDITNNAQIVCEGNGVDYKNTGNAKVYDNKANLGAIIGYISETGNIDAFNITNNGNIKFVKTDKAYNIGGIIGNVSTESIYLSKLYNCINNANMNLSFNDNVETAVGGIIGRIGSVTQQTVEYTKLHNNNIMSNKVMYEGGIIGINGHSKLNINDKNSQKSYITIKLKDCTSTSEPSIDSQYASRTVGWLNFALTLSNVTINTSNELIQSIPFYKNNSSSHVILKDSTYNGADFIKVSSAFQITGSNNTGVFKFDLTDMGSEFSTGLEHIIIKNNSDTPKSVSYNSDNYDVEKTIVIEENSRFNAISVIASNVTVTNNGHVNRILGMSRCVIPTICQLKTEIKNLGHEKNSIKIINGKKGIIENVNNNAIELHDYSKAEVHNYGKLIWNNTYLIHFNNTGKDTKYEYYDVTKEDELYTKYYYLNEQNEKCYGEINSNKFEINDKSYPIENNSIKIGEITYNLSPTHYKKINDELKEIIPVAKQTTSDVYIYNDSQIIINKNVTSNDFTKKHYYISNSEIIYFELIMSNDGKKYFYKDGNINNGIIDIIDNHFTLDGVSYEVYEEDDYFIAVRMFANDSGQRYTVHSEYDEYIIKDGITYKGQVDKKIEGGN